jgi:hypothetical protein
VRTSYRLLPAPGADRIREGERTEKTGRGTGGIFPWMKSTVYRHCKSEYMYDVAPVYRHCKSEYMYDVAHVYRHCKSEYIYAVGPIYRHCKSEYIGICCWPCL